MRVRMELYRSRVWLEIALALSAAAYVVWILLARPDGVLGLSIDRFTHFPLAVGLGVWLPLLARTRWSVLGELYRDGDALVVAGGWRTRRIVTDPERAARPVGAGRAARAASTSPLADIVRFTYNVR